VSMLVSGLSPVKGVYLAPEGEDFVLARGDESVNDLLGDLCTGLAAVAGNGEERVSTAGGTGDGDFDHDVWFLGGCWGN